MTEPTKDPFSGILRVRIGVALIGVVVILVTLYVSFWVLVSGLGLVKARGVLAIPLLLGIGLTSLVSPTLPTIHDILDGRARIAVASLKRHIFSECAVFSIGVVIGCLALKYGAFVPTKSEVTSVQVSGSNATLTFDRKFEGPPPFVNGLMISIMVSAFGTAIAAARSAYKASQLRGAVREMNV